MGMANSEGGEIYLGVNPSSNKIEGVQDVPSAIDHLFQACLLSEPTLVLPVPTAHPVAELTVLEISVPQGLPHDRHFYQQAVPYGP